MVTVSNQSLMPEKEEPAVNSAPRLQKVLTWRDGMAIAITLPTGLLVTVGYAIGALGTWTAISIWIGATLVGYLQSKLFAELAAMFPNKSGGISRYAIEGWKRYFAPLGAVASFGYWIGWSFSIGVNAAAIGALVQAEWFPHSTWSIPFLTHAISLPTVVALLAIAAGWAMNYFGVKLAARVTRVTGSIVIGGLLLLVLAPLFSTASFTLTNLTWSFQGSWMTVVVWFYITSWTTYGGEICASFAPEYRDTVRDTSKALNRTGILMLAVFFFVPMSMSGAVGEKAIGANPVAAFSRAFDHLLGGTAPLGVGILIIALFLGMVATTADGGRALYGLAQEGMTLRQLDHLNRWGVPGRSLTLDAILNSAIVLLLGEPIAILLASNLGYLVSITLAIGSFLLLRRDRPNWPRPIRRGSAWVPIAFVLFAFNIFVLAIGITHPQLAGYGGFTETAVGIGILLLSIVIYAFRKIVQDKEPMRWRIETEPDAAAQLMEEAHD